MRPPDVLHDPVDGLLHGPRQRRRALPEAEGVRGEGAVAVAQGQVPFENVSRYFPQTHHSVISTVLPCDDGPDLPAELLHLPGEELEDPFQPHVLLVGSGWKNKRKDVKDVNTEK